MQAWAIALIVIVIVLVILVGIWYMRRRHRRHLVPKNDIENDQYELRVNMLPS